MLGVAALVVLVATVRFVERRRTDARVSSGGFLALAVVIACLIVWTEERGRSLTRRALADPRTYVSEGRVEHFTPEAWGGHSGDESFYVDGARFSYSQFVVTGAFHQTASHGGPIREGLPVRVTHLAERILKLEVGDSSDSPDSPDGAQRVDDAARR